MLSSQFLQYMQLHSVCYSQVLRQVTGDTPSPAHPAPLLPSDGRDSGLGLTTLGPSSIELAVDLSSHGVFLLPYSIRKGKWVEKKLLVPHSIQLLIVLREMEEAKKETERYSLW